MTEDELEAWVRREEAEWLAANPPPWLWRRPLFAAGLLSLALWVIIWLVVRALT